MSEAYTVKDLLFYYATAFPWHQTASGAKFLKEVDCSTDRVKLMSAYLKETIRANMEATKPEHSSIWTDLADIALKQADWDAIARDTLEYLGIPVELATYRR